LIVHVILNLDHSSLSKSSVPPNGIRAWTITLNEAIQCKGIGKYVELLTQLYDAPSSKLNKETRI